RATATPGEIGTPRNMNALPQTSECIVETRLSKMQADVTTRISGCKKKPAPRTRRSAKSEAPAIRNRKLLVLLRVLLDEFLRDIALQSHAFLARRSLEQIDEVRRHLLFLRSEIRLLRRDQRQKLLHLAQPFV